MTWAAGQGEGVHTKSILLFRASLKIKSIGHIDRSNISDIMENKINLNLADSKRTSESIVELNS